jgi:hypothetical protein
VHFRVTCLLGSTVLLAGCLGGTAGGSRGSWGGIGLFPPPDTPSVLRANYAGTMTGNVTLPDLPVGNRTVPGPVLPYTARLAIEIDYDESRQPVDNRIAATADQFRISGTVNPNITVPNVTIPGVGTGDVTINSVTATAEFEGTLKDENGTIDYDARSLRFGNLTGDLTTDQATATVSGSVRSCTFFCVVLPVNNYPIPAQDLGTSLSTSPSLQLNGSFNGDYTAIDGTATGNFFPDTPIDGEFNVSRVVP